MRSQIFLSILALLISACASDEEKAQKTLMTDATRAGDKIATVAFQSLSGHLKGAMQTGGIENAISYCNINAIPLTDSLSKNYDVRIKRTSTNLRNPSNQPDSLENYMLDLYQQILKMRKPMVGKAILAKDQNVRYFAPIMMKQQCLMCHGTLGQEVTDSTYQLIKSRYPADQAVGYKEGQLRGIWSLNFGSMENTRSVIESFNSKIPELKD